MKKTFVANTKCPYCDHTILIDTTIRAEDVHPTLKSGLVPNGSVLIYKITSADMTQYLSDIVHAFCADARIEVVPRYCEKKTHKGEPHCAYASLRIALSDHVIAKNANVGWYGKIGESRDNVQVIDSIFANLISKFKYRREDVDKWMDYKNLDMLEEHFGITESYLNDLRRFTDIQLVRSNDNRNWVFFAADPTLIIRDMLTEAPDENGKAGKVAGDIRIMDVRQINKDMIEYTIYLCNEKTSSYENPHVRMLLTGEEK